MSLQNAKLSRNHSPLINADIDQAIGAALRNLREERQLSARQLAQESDISAAMISRIESGQVSPSIATMTALCNALDVPLVSLFRDTGSERSDYTLVKKGGGLKSTRMVGDHIHHYLNLAHHRRRDLQFEAHMVTLTQQQADLPVYVGHGVTFMHAIVGQARFEYGKQQFMLSEGDSLSLDAELSHGCTEILTPEFVFLSVQAESRR